jgi:hypothetical protein
VDEILEKFCFIWGGVVNADGLKEGTLKDLIRRRGRSHEGVPVRSGEGPSPSFFYISQEYWPVILVVPRVLGDHGNDECGIITESFRTAIAHHGEESTDEC